MYLSNYSIRATVLLSSFFMAAGSGIRWISLTYPFKPKAFYIV